jgi:GT2 family glycosyltransferase
MSNIASIMVATFNRLSLTKQTINNLIEMTDYPFELIVIDNASVDGTVEYLKNELESLLSKNSYFCSLIIKENDINKGIAYARNQSLLLASGEWLCTLDNDVLLPKGWLTKCISVLSRNKNYGAIGVNMEAVTYPLVLINGEEFQKKQQGNLGTACMVFPKSFHKMLGFFNTEMGLYGQDDSDMGMRARVAGYELGYIKENGKHLGEGENDTGEYRTFKTNSHANNMTKFNENCRLYATRKKPIYIPFKP